MGLKLSCGRSMIFPFYYVFLWTTFGLVVISLGMIYGGEGINLEDDIVNLLKSPQFSYILIVEISCSSLLLLDIFLDCHFSKWSTILLRLDFYNLCCTLMSSLFMLFSAIPRNNFVAIAIIRHMRIYFFICGVSIFASHTGRSVWRSLFYSSAHPIAAVAMTFMMLAKFPQFSSQAESTYQIGVTLGGIASTILVTTFLRWLILVLEKMRSSQLTDDEIHCTVNTSLVVCLEAALFISVIGSKVSPFQDFSVSSLCSYEYAFVIYAVLDALYKSHVKRRTTNRYKNELEFKRMFVCHISHEIRTPLNTAIMGLQVMLEDLKKFKDSQLLDTTADVKASCDTAVTVLNELLAFDKLESGTMMLEKEEVNALQFVKNIVHPFLLQARASHVSLTVETNIMKGDDLSSLMIHVDRHKMEQVVRNLVSNALKFTPKGGSVKVEIFVEVDKENFSNLLKIAVTDTGAGISEQNQKKLFKEIIQFNPAKLQKGGGSGLGLYISYGIAKLHDGEITVYSKGEGLGSVFTLVLPIGYVSNAAHNTASKSSLMTPYHDGFMRAFRMGKGRDTAIHVIQEVSSDSGEEGEDDISLQAYPDGLDDRRRHCLTGSEAEKVSLDIKRNSESRNRFVSDPFESALESENNLKSSCYLEGLDSSAHKPKKRASVFLPPVPTEKYLKGNDMVESNDIEVSQNEINIQERNRSQKQHALGDMRMLIVDDSMPSRKMQSRLLRKHYKECIQAENGLEAVQHIRNMLEDPTGYPSIDIIVIDSEMPVMNGPDAIKAIRELGYKGIVIGLTGHVSPSDLADFLDHGADVVLSKPLELQDFNLALKEVLKSW